MDNLILGIKYLILSTTTAIVTAVSSAVPMQQEEIINPTPEPTPVVAGQDIVTREGEYSYKGYALKYSINVPQKGGTISGSFSGVCEGPITGTFDGKEGGKVEGEAKAICKVAILTFDLKAKYDGALYLKTGKVDINWEGEIPYTQNKGSFTVNFEPLSN